MVRSDTEEVYKQFLCKSKVIVDTTTKFEGNANCQCGTGYNKKKKAKKRKKKQKEKKRKKQLRQQSKESFKEVFLNFLLKTDVTLKWLEIEIIYKNYCTKQSKAKESKAKERKDDGY
uniref:Uncharacterized protein n=1 Tax=Glossina palpalis gambiensis TaxID=67801 RepID=A0A1B0B800_9MUSC